MNKRMAEIMSYVGTHPCSNKDYNYLGSISEKYVKYIATERTRVGVCVCVCVSMCVWTVRMRIIGQEGENRRMSE